MAKRREIFEWYCENLSHDLVEFMPEVQDSRGNRWLTTLRFKHSRANPMELVEILAKKGIESRPLWKPMHLQPLFRDSMNFCDGSSQELFNSGICLPSGGAMDKEIVFEISNYVLDYLKSL